uniref:Uncharacterized protein n=1 Tax=virus sp. ctQmo6 TaxID=2827990 RepID=A0A8S5RG59_9VIRU|nr:MAG TPA: hypothetical protein [virus sp. ctQmo6]
MKNQKNKGGCLKTIICLFLVLGFFSWIFGLDDSDTDDDTSSGYEEEYVPPTNIPNQLKKVKKKTFYQKLEDGIGNKKVAKKTYNVLKKKIGFTKLDYKKKLRGTTNYKIQANGYDVVITASNKLYRIFTPRGYTWYENGKVKNTYKKIRRKEKRTSISSSARVTYYSMAKEIVEQGLSNPGSAKFPSMTFHPGDIAMSRNGKLVTVQSYVDAENAFGGTVRNNWTAQFRMKSMKNYTYNVQYLEIGGQKIYGSYKK